MASFFPHQTVEIRLEEPRAFRRLSFSLAAMAILTGVLVRAFRALALSHDSASWWYLLLTIGIGTILLLGMLTAHLANFPLHRWLWRAPLFWVIEVAAEMATSALLIAIGREATGAVRATAADWPGMLARTLLLRGLVIMIWSMALAGAVHVVRTRLVRDDHEPDPISSESES